MKYISHLVRTVTALDNYVLLIEYCEGVARLYDVKPLFDRIPVFNQLKKNNLFSKVKVDCGGYGISWNEEIDLAAEEPYYNGTPIQSRFDGIMALGDAAEIWNMDDSTLRHAIANGKFKCGTDITKFGKQWVITIEAMVREYGEPKQ
jgi:hypothetical protein